MISQKNIFLVGIKGVAMADLAVIMTKMGKHVAGADVEEEFITDEVLKKHEIKAVVGFDEQNLPQDVDIVVYSAAHGGTSNPLVLEAQKRNITVMHQAEFIGELMQGFATKIAVAGSHGKTTTSAITAYTLSKLGQKLGYLVGTASFAGMEGGGYTGDDYFVIEADEYGVNPPLDKTPKFLSLNPDYILCTNIDFDDPDVFESIGEVKKSFAEFFKKGKKIIACGDDTVVHEVLESFPKEKYIVYGIQDHNDLIVKNISVSEQGTTFSVGNEDYSIRIFGEKNALNAAGVVTLLLQLGFSKEQIADALKDFSGVKRRFEKVGEYKGVTLFDDYAHHPQEIRATIAAARAVFRSRKIGVIFQPHTFSRTQALAEEFAQALSLADYAVVAPIFASARENPASYTVTSADIARINEAKLVALSEAEILPHLASTVQPGDVVFTMGAGDIYKLAHGIIETLEKAL